MLSRRASSRLTAAEVSAACARIKLWNPRERLPDLADRLEERRRLTERALQLRHERANPSGLVAVAQVCTRVAALMRRKYGEHLDSRKGDGFELTVTATPLNFHQEEPTEGSEAAVLWD